MEKKLMAVLSVIKPQDCSHREAGLFHGICTEYISQSNFLIGIIQIQQGGAISIAFLFDYGVLGVVETRNVVAVE